MSGVSFIAGVWCGVMLMAVVQVVGARKRHPSTPADAHTPDEPKPEQHHCDCDGPSNGLRTDHREWCNTNRSTPDEPKGGE